LDENNIYKLLNKSFVKKNKSFVNTIGDDAAIWKFGKKQIAISCDSQIENIHFTQKFSNLYQIGYRSITIAISDLSAMGANPLFFTNSLNIKKGMQVKEINKIYEGFKDAAKDYNIELVGGNIVSSNFFSIDITVVGDIKNNFISRGAKNNEKLYVTGNIGSANAGLRLLKKNISTKPNELINSYKKPSPNILESKILASTGLISSMMDITDGLLNDLRKLINFKNKNLGAQLYWNKIPKSNLLNKYFKVSLVKDIVLNGGDDYQLLFTVKKNHDKKFEKLMKKNRIDVFNIGYTNNNKSIKLELNGLNKIVKEKGYVHKF